MSLWFVKPSSGTSGIGVGDVVGIDPADVGDHEIGWVDALDREEAMLREQRLELRAKEEIDPDEQDRRHAWRTLPAGAGNNHYDVLSPIFAKTWSSAIRSHQSRLKKSSSPSAIRVHPEATCSAW